MCRSCVCSPCHSARLVGRVAQRRGEHVLRALEAALREVVVGEHEVLRQVSAYTGRPRACARRTSSSAPAQVTCTTSSGESAISASRIARFGRLRLDRLRARERVPPRLGVAAARAPAPGAWR